jgi:predicted aspartyl protease
MISLRALVAAVVLLAVEPRSAVAGTTCVPAQLAPSAYPVLLVKTRVNGQGPYMFFVDTGATVSIISTALAAKLRLKQSPTPVHGIGAGGRVDARASFASIAVGGAYQDRVALATFDLSQISAAVGPIDGALGYNFLKAYRVTIDYPGHELCLEN